MNMIRLEIAAILILALSCSKDTVEPSNQPNPDGVMTYQVEVKPTWNSQSPAWPDQDAHFSWIGGAVHSARVKFWEVGTLASPGIDMMSVTGLTTDLISEIQIEIVASKDFPLITLVSMLGPSPDWFIGVESLSLTDGSGIFIPEIIYELFPFDAGILSDNSVLARDCCDREPLSMPQDIVHLITSESGETIGPGSLGQIIFTAIPE